MKTIKFLLFAIFSISMCIACSEKDSTDEPDFQGELRTKAALENMLLGQWAEVSPTKNGCIISFTDDELIFNQSVYKGFSDTVSCVYQVLTGELIQITIGDKSADYKVVVYDDDNITIKEFIPAVATVYPPLYTDITLQRVPPVLVEPEEPVSKSDSLAGTQWKLAGIVDAKTGEMKTLEPKDCKECYTLVFDSDNTFSGRITNNVISSGKCEIDYTTYALRIIDIAGTEAIDLADGDLYRQILWKIQSYSLQENELKLYFEQEDKQYYLLYNKLETKESDNFSGDNIIGKWQLLEVSISINYQESKIIDFSNDNIIYDFNDNNILVVKGFIPDDLFVFDNFREGEHSYAYQMQMFVRLVCLLQICLSTIRNQNRLKDVIIVKLIRIII